MRNLNINLRHLLLLSLVIKFFFFLLFLNFNNNPYIFEFDYQKIINNFFFLDLNLNESFGSERLPIYQFFLVLSYSLFNSKIFISIIQILLSTLNILIIFKIGNLFNKKLGIILAAIAVFNPSYILFSFLILADYLFLFFSLLFIYFFLKFLKKNSLKCLILSFVFLGCMSLTKPVIIYFPIFLVFFIFFFQEKKKIISIFLLLVIFYSINSIWILRNKVTYGDFFYTSQNKTNIINWYLPLIEQEQKKIDLKIAKKNIQAQWLQYKKLNINDTESSNVYYEDGLSKKFFLNQIKKYDFFVLVKSVLQGSLKSIFLPSFSEYKYFFNFKSNLAFSKLEGISFINKIQNYYLNLKIDFFYLSLILTTLTTLFLRYYQFKFLIKNYGENKQVFFFIIIYVSYFLFISGPIGSARYRLPFEFFFIFTLGQFLLYKMNKFK